MALQGHYLFTDAIFETVWRLWQQFGEKAREKLYALPDVPADASKRQIADWEERVCAIETELVRERNRDVAAGG